MRTNNKIIRARITKIGPLVRIRKTAKSYRVVEFASLEDDTTYTLCVMNGHKNASRFLKLPIGTRLSGVVVYKENGKDYVDGNSNFKHMTTKPLF